MKSEIAHKIKHRKKPRNDFYTPKGLAKELVKMVPLEQFDIVLDNAYKKKSGTAFFDSFPDFVINQFCTEDMNFMFWKAKQHWLITNPPYSFLDLWLEHSCDIALKGFAYLLGIHNLTPRRIEMCERKGFKITKIHMCKVFKWFGISVFVVWEKTKKKRKVELTYDRIVWR